MGAIPRTEKRLGKNTNIRVTAEGKDTTKGLKSGTVKITPK